MPDRFFMIDLCCGLGGASEAARQRGWRVQTLDITTYVKPQIVGDLRSLPLRRGLAPDLLWISPCCKQYTRARLPWGPRIVPDNDLMRAAVMAVEWLKPRLWVIENVPGSVRWVQDFMGAPTQRTWAHVFWSNFATLLPQVRPHKRRISSNCKFTHYRRSLIPYEVAHAFTTAAEGICANGSSRDEEA